MMITKLDSSTPITGWQLPPLREGGGRVFLLLLAIALMLLASCKTRQSVEMSTDTLSVHSLSIKDSLHSEFSFLFDKMDIWLMEEAPSQPPPVGEVKRQGEREESLGKQGVYIRVSNGQIANERMETKSHIATDSIEMKTEEVIRPVRTPPKIISYIIPIAIILCFVCLIMRSRSR